jgi:hypothetical protein
LAVASSVSGTSMPNALAVLTFMLAPERARRCGDLAHSNHILHLAVFHGGGLDGDELVQAIEGQDKRTSTTSSASF